MLGPQTTDANRLIPGFVEVPKPTLGPSIVVATELGDALWTIQVDRPQLENCLSTLAIDARDAMPGGGTLIVRTDNARFAECDPKLLDDGEAGHDVMVSLSGTGEGMPPATVRRPRGAT